MDGWMGYGYVFVVRFIDIYIFFLDTLCGRYRILFNIIRFDGSEDGSEDGFYMSRFLFWGILNALNLVFFFFFFFFFFFAFRYLWLSKK